jgi:hypothetical protein
MVIEPKFSRLPVPNHVIGHILNQLRLFVILRTPELLVIQCVKYIKKPLCHIYNASFESGIFSDRLKIAKVKPFYKKGDIHDVQNYRPISLLSVF